MTDQPPEHEQESPPHGGHASVRTYVAVAAVLTGVTAIEVAATYVQSLTPILVPTLLLLSLAKFALVALFFMHLRYDSRLLATLFGAPLVIAIVIVLALTALIHAVMVRA